MSDENSIKRVAEEEPLVFEEQEDGKLTIAGTLENLREILGTSNCHAGGAFLQQLIAVVDPDSKDMPRHCNTVAPLLRAISPKDELESMLAVQMIGVHSMAMEMMRRGMQADHTSHVDSCTNRVTKLSRTFLAQLEALNKHRGAAQQKVVVEHVNVSDGGQAIVAGSIGGGKSEN